MADKQLTIDPEYRDLCRALMPEERSLLEASIDAGGCRDAIVTWANHDDTILDGHNRYEICTQLEKPFKTKALNLPDRQACIEWIISNQLGKRNLTEAEKSFLRGKRYRVENRGHGGDRKSSGQNAHLKTAEKLAEEYNVDEKTIRRDADFADAVDTIAATVGKEAKTEILSETSGLTRKQIQEVAAAPPAEQPKAYKEAKCHVSHNSGNNEWYTPDEYLDAAREVLGGIDLDPASSEVAQERVKAKRFYTCKDDGLSKRWKGRVWLNPPYASGLVEKFVGKLREHLEKQEVTSAVVLVNNATDTAWFQASAIEASAICFPAGRIKYLAPDGEAKNSPVQGQAVLYFGDAAEQFVSVFQSFGFCAEVCAQ